MFDYDLIELMPRIRDHREERGFCNLITNNKLIHLPHN
jgi:hypothetical protein